MTPACGPGGLPGLACPGVQASAPEEASQAGKATAVPAQAHPAAERAGRARSPAGRRGRPRRRRTAQPPRNGQRAARRPRPAATQPVRPRARVRPAVARRAGAEVLRRRPPRDLGAAGRDRRAVRRRHAAPPGPPGDRRTRAQPARLAHRPAPLQGRQGRRDGARARRRRQHHDRDKPAWRLGAVISTTTSARW